MRKESGRHFLAVAVACTIWGGSVIGTKLSYDSLAPMSLGLLRFALSSILFFVLLALKKELSPPRGKDLALIATYVTPFHRCLLMTHQTACPKLRE